MRTILILSFIAFGNFAFSQSKVNAERLWVNVNHGFNLYNEVGAQVQIFDQFLIGGYLQNFQRKMKPGLAHNPNALFFSLYDYKRNNVNSASSMIGFASPTPHAVILSFLAGPSLNLSTIQTNVHIAEANSGGKYIASTETKTWNVGANYKATLGFCLGDNIILNFGLAGNYSKVEKYNRFIIGLGVGKFGRDQTKNNPKSIEGPSRIIIIQ